ncbi:MAG: hypothetical protein ACTHNN_13085 [Xanthobacteraceae bacterium]
MAGNAFHLIAHLRGAHVVVFASPVNLCPALGIFPLLTQSSVVMPGFMPGIHVLKNIAGSKTWMAGTSPAMTAI